MDNDKTEGVGAETFVNRKGFEDAGKGLYSGLHRVYEKNETGVRYDVVPEKMPNDETVKNYFEEKKYYLSNLLKGEKDFESQRRLEMAEQKTRLALETLKGNVSRGDLVAAEMKSIALACSEWLKLGTRHTEDTLKLMHARTTYFDKLASIYEQKYKTGPVEVNLNNATADRKEYVYTQFGLESITGDTSYGDLSGGEMPGKSENDFDYLSLLNLQSMDVNDFFNLDKDEVYRSLKGLNILPADNERKIKYMKIMDRLFEGKESYLENNPGSTSVEL